MTRANSIWRIPYITRWLNYEVSNFIQLSGGHGGPDGLALDANGGVLVAHAGLGTVWHFDNLGQPLHGYDLAKGL